MRGPPPGKRGQAGYDWPLESLPNFQSSALTLCSCFVLIGSPRELAMGLDNLRSEIAFMRLQVSPAAQGNPPAPAGRDWTKRFSTVAGALDIPGEAIIDGEVVAERLDGRAVAIDPGEHVFRFERAGMVPAERMALRRLLHAGATNAARNAPAHTPGRQVRDRVTS